MTPHYKNRYRFYTEEEIEKLREMQVLYQLGISHHQQIDKEQFGNNYDRNKVLTAQIHLLNEQERKIKKQIRLATLIRAAGTEMLGLENPEKSVRENTDLALELMLEPKMESIFTSLASLTEEKAAEFDASLQRVLLEFQTLYKNNTPEDDPEIEKLIRQLLDLTFSLAPVSLKYMKVRHYHLGSLFDFEKLAS